MSKQKKCIVFLGVDMDLFKTCFFIGKEADIWSSYELIVLDDDSDTVSSDLSKLLLSKPCNVLSVVFQHTELKNTSLRHMLRQFYDSGGLMVFFGIDGEFADPGVLSKHFALTEAWKFSAYTAHEYEITSIADSSIGLNVTELEYAKANLLSVPIQDRWLVPKVESLHRYIDDHAGCLDGEAPSEEWKREARAAKAGYVDYCESLYNQCPLAVHTNNNGNNGRLAYLGFVNGDGPIPCIVRALVTKTKICDAN